MADTINAMNAYSMDPMWLAYAQSNPSFKQAPATGTTKAGSAYTTQTSKTSETATDTATGVEALPKADYSSGSSATGLLVGGTVVAGAAALICGIKGKGSITKGAKAFWNGLKGVTEKNNRKTFKKPSG